MTARKTDGGKGDRIPGANQTAYEAGYAGIQWGDGIDETCGSTSARDAQQPSKLTTVEFDSPDPLQTCDG